MDCFEIEVAALADQSSFNRTTGTVTSQFANGDDFLDKMENELGSDNGNICSTDNTVNGTPRGGATIDISKSAKASLASALNNPDMDLIANFHASKKSRRTKFLSSTGNSTNCSVNTEQFAVAHKERALAHAKENRHLAQLENKICKMACRLRALEELYASGTVPPCPPSSPGLHANATFSRADHCTTQGNRATCHDEEVLIVDTKKEYEENSNKSDVGMEGTNDPPSDIPSKQDDTDLIE
jgi:hypothetical protein